MPYILVRLYLLHSLLRSSSNVQCSKILKASLLQDVIESLYCEVNHCQVSVVTYIFDKDSYIPNLNWFHWLAR